MSSWFQDSFFFPFLLCFCLFAHFFFFFDSLRPPGSRKEGNSLSGKFQRIWPRHKTQRRWQAWPWGCQEQPRVGPDDRATITMRPVKAGAEAVMEASEVSVSTVGEWMECRGGGSLSHPWQYRKCRCRAYHIHHWTSFFWSIIKTWQMSWGGPSLGTHVVIHQPSQCVTCFSGLINSAIDFLHKTFFSWKLKFPTKKIDQFFQFCSIDLQDLI